MSARPGFLGYRRPDGRVGTRNYVLVVPTVICSSVVAERVAAAAAPIGTALPHLAGCGQLGPDMRVTHETLAAYCAHPNVGAVLVVALGCEQVVAQSLAESARHGKPADIIAIQSEGGTVRATAKGVAIAQAFAGQLSAQEREWCDVSEIVLSLKCGGSDYTSAWPRTPRLAAWPTASSISEAARCWGDRRDHGRRASARVTRHPAGDLGEVDSGHHTRRDGSACAGSRHQRHTAIAWEHSWRPHDDRREVARRHDKGGERAPLEDVVGIRRRSRARA